MRSEIDELKRMNNKLCETILVSQPHATGTTTTVQPGNQNVKVNRTDRTPTKFVKQ